MTIQNLVVLQARMSSARLPGKVMMKVNGTPMIYWQIQRILKSKKVGKLVVATSLDSTDDPLVSFLEEKSIIVHRGSLDNVLSRYVEVAMHFPHDALIRLTGDCPLVMPDLMDLMIDQFHEEKVDYLSNTLIPTFPDGLDIEIIKPGILQELATFKLEARELEHVTYGVYHRPERFRLSNFLNDVDRSSDRWTVDYQEDLDFVRGIFEEFSGREASFSYRDVCSFLAKRPDLQSQILRYQRNGGLN
jgi:spore coat polysaccharide biosynthesis protein SpsF